MRTETINIYTLDELSEAAKAKAIEHYRNTDTEPFHYNDENLTSIRGFCDRFRVQIKNYQISPYEKSWVYTNAEPVFFRGVKLRDFTGDECPTGYCLDYTLYEEFYRVFEKTGDAFQAFRAAIDEAVKLWRTDMEYQLSDEYIAEHMMANEYEFTQDGKEWTQ